MDIKPILDELAKEEAKRVAAMTPEERATYDEKNRNWKAFQEHLAEPVTMTRGEEMLLKQAHEEELEKTHDSAFGDALIKAAKATQPILEEERQHTGNARTHQSTQDKKIAKLEAQVAKLTEERDAALKARDEMLKLYLDQQAKRGE